MVEFVTVDVTVAEAINEPAVCVPRSVVNEPRISEHDDIVCASRLSAWASEARTTVWFRVSTRTPFKVVDPALGVISRDPFHCCHPSRNSVDLGPHRNRTWIATAGGNWKDGSALSCRHRAMYDAPADRSTVTSGTVLAAAASARQSTSRGGELCEYTPRVPSDVNTTTARATRKRIIRVRQAHVPSTYRTTSTTGFQSCTLIIDPSNGQLYTRDDHDEFASTNCCFYK
jgi:hypothetical protein